MMFSMPTNIQLSLLNLNRGSARSDTDTTAVDRVCLPGMVLKTLLSIILRAKTNSYNSFGGLVEHNYNS